MRGFPLRSIALTSLGSVYAIYVNNCQIAGTLCDAALQPSASVEPVPGAQLRLVQAVFRWFLHGKIQNLFQCQTIYYPVLCFPIPWRGPICVLLNAKRKHALVKLWMIVGWCCYMLGMLFCFFWCNEMFGRLSQRTWLRPTQTGTQQYRLFKD